MRSALVLFVAFFVSTATAIPHSGDRPVPLPLADRVVGPEGHDSLLLLLARSRRDVVGADPSVPTSGADWWNIQQPGKNNDNNNEIAFASPAIVEA